MQNRCGGLIICWRCIKSGLFAKKRGAVRVDGDHSLDRTGAYRGCTGQADHAGSDPGGIIVTILIGIVGGLLGGFIGQLLGFGGVTGINIGSILWAVVGSLILLALYRVFAGRRV